MRNDSFNIGLLFLAVLLFLMMFGYYGRLYDKEYISTLKKGQVSQDEEECVTF